MERSPGVKQGFEWMMAVSNAWSCKVPGHMEPWRKGEIGNSWSLGLRGAMKNVPSGSGDQVRGYGGWDEAVSGEGVCINTQLPGLQPPASSTTINHAGLDLYLNRL